MENMESKINAILSDPDTMQKIMAMAQSLNQSQPPPEPQAPTPSPSPMPDIDFSMVQRLSGLVGQSNIDKNQKSLLSALGPYLSRDRIQKLEKAMRAAKMANMASLFLGGKGR